MIKPNKVILLIEDSPDDEELTLEALKSNNISNDIVVARDGQEALDYLFGQGLYKDRDTRDVPQLVLLDLKLPKVDGIEVLKRIRSDERTRYLRVVILTSSKEEKDVVAGYALGANSYICKPVNFGQFMESVKQLSLYWLVLDEKLPNIGAKP